MKNFSVLSLALCVGLVVPTVSDGGPGAPIYQSPGDVNGDGRLNLADVSYLANFLFGIPPADPPAICQPFPQLIEGFALIGTNPETGLSEYRHLDTNLDFVLLPGGTFLMGAQSTDPEGPNYDPHIIDCEGPVHEVTVTPFLIGKYEVTQDIYEAVTGENPSSFPGADRPVEELTGEDLVAPDGFLALTGLSLPTEAQWEYACRGGTTTQFSFGDCENPDGFCELADDYMWWGENSNTDGTGLQTHPVGEKLPNPFGLYDMHGNAWEICLDLYDENFFSSPEAAGPDPLSTTGPIRVGRGGARGVNTRSCRSATRRAPGTPTCSGRGGGDGGIRPVFWPIP